MGFNILPVLLLLGKRREMEVSTGAHPTLEHCIWDTITVGRLFRSVVVVATNSSTQALTLATCVGVSLGALVNEIIVARVELS